MYLSYVGIRVSDPRRSEAFYRDVFGLVVAEGMDWAKWTPSEPACVLLRDPVSGQRLELNYYPESSPYGTPYRTGEDLDHIAFRVDDLPAFLAKLAALGYPAEKMAHYDGPYSTGAHLKMAYVRDPDGIQLELFQSVTGEPRPFRPHEY